MCMATILTEKDKLVIQDIEIIVNGLIEYVKRNRNRPELHLDNLNKKKEDNNSRVDMVHLYKESNRQAKLLELVKLKLGDISRRWPGGAVPSFIMRLGQIEGIFEETFDLYENKKCASGEFKPNLEIAYWTRVLQAFDIIINKREISLLRMGFESMKEEIGIR